MNNLEFIDKEIEATESAINVMQEMLNDKVYCYFNKESVLDSLNKGKKRLQTLQQIKTVLEAWEVVKNTCVDIHDIINCSNLEVYNTSLYKEYQLTEKEYKVIKKALEVKDE